ncbi:hypothetical protein C8R47DRAFT_1290558 [Mycena vitilis]|nr:hypothetical protein C8R47DRAFT_1290558 [Mycena vitilis]
MSVLRKEDEDVVEALAGVVYPVLSLPNEITSEIFTRYVDKDLMLNRRYGKQHYSPLCLSSVCSLWRALALSQCSLWTHLGWRRDEPSHLPDLLRIWLPRAGGLPLHLNLSLPASSTQSANVLRTLGQYSAQWQSLEIGSPGPVAFPNSIRGPFPCLTKFHLQAFDSSDGWTTLPLLSNALFLREVHLNSVYPQNWQSSIPGSQLTKLELTYFDIESSLNMLALTPNLEDLDFTCDIRNSGPDPAPSPPLTLPHLHTIGLGAEHGPELLNYLVLPALDFIDIGFTDESTDEIEGTVARSGCTPRRFEFYMYEPGFERIYRCMAIMPTLRRLQMRCPCGSATDYQQFFDTLTQDPTILPALETLEIVQCRAEIALPTLVRMLEARTAGAAKLRSFSLLFEDDGGHEFGADLLKLTARMDHALDGLRVLSSQGLKVDITSNIKWLSENISSQFITEMGEHNWQS